jgi:hypothetical protein
MRSDLLIRQIAEAVELRDTLGDVVGELRQGLGRADADAGWDAHPLPDGGAQLAGIGDQARRPKPEKSRKLSSKE